MLVFSFIFIEERHLTYIRHLVDIARKYSCLRWLCLFVLVILVSDCKFDALFSLIWRKDPFDRKYSDAVLSNFKNLRLILWFFPRESSRLHILSLSRMHSLFYERRRSLRDFRHYPVLTWVRTRILFDWVSTLSTKFVESSSALLDPSDEAERLRICSPSPVLTTTTWLRIPATSSYSLTHSSGWSLDDLFFSIVLHIIDIIISDKNEKNPRPSRPLESLCECVTSWRLQSLSFPFRQTITISLPRKAFAYVRRT